MTKLGRYSWTAALFAAIAADAHAFPVSTAPVGLGESAIAVDAAGIATIVWTIDDVPDTAPLVLGRRFDAAGDPVGPEYQVNTIAGQFVQNVDIGMNAGDESVVVWAIRVAGLYRIYARRYDALGAALGPEIEVGTELYAATLPTVAIDATGGFLVVWGSQGPIAGDVDDEVLARHYDDTGAPTGAAFTVNTTQAFAPYVDVTFTGAGYAVVWSGNPATGTRVQRFDTGANAVGTEIAVTSETYRPSIASAGDGGFIVVATDGATDVQAWRYDANGDPVGAAIPVSMTSSTIDARVAMDGGGAFVAVWQVFVGTLEDPQQRIRGRRFDAGGTALTDEFDLSSPADDFVGFSAVGVLPAGGFIATWTRDFFDDGSVEGLTWRPLTPVAGTNFTIKDRATPNRRTVKLKLKDPLVNSIAELGIDGVSNGMAVHVFNTQATGDAACFTLPAPAWIEKPTRLGPKYKYLDSAHVNGPCRSAQAKRGEVKVSCRATVQPIPYSLDEASQGSIGVVVTSGNATYCAEFGGIKKDEPGVFAGAKAPRPAVCPTPPGPCP